MTILLQTFADAGFVGPILLACSVLMWWGLGVRMFTLRAAWASHDVDEALQHATKGRTLFDFAVQAIHAEASRRSTVTHQHLEGVAKPFRAALAAHATTIRSTVAVAPLAGLLGTVTGMIETFDSLGSMELFSRGGGIGAGISEAMISTQMGLVVAVPGLLLGAMLERRQVALEDQLEAVIDRLARGAAT